jgi:hypothetical protein
MSKDNSTDIAIQKFLDRGGVIQKVGRNVSGSVDGFSYSAWGRPKKPAAVVAVKEEVVIDEIDEDLEVDEDIVVVEKEDNE